MAKTFLAFGELLWDLLPTATILGGAPFNFVYRVNALGDRGLMVSRLGRDELGKQAFDKVVVLGVETTYLQWDERYPTGTVKISFDADNNPDFVIIPGVAYDFMESSDALLDMVAKVDCLCFGTLAQRSPKSRQTLERLISHASNSLKFLDINLRKDCYGKDTVLSSLHKADVLKLNEDEAHKLAQMLDLAHATIPQFCEALFSKWPLKYCLVTLADCGAFAFSHRNEQIYSPGYRVDSVDSLGSGDAFSAGFVHKILRDRSTGEAVEYGNALGALVVTTEGATAAISTKEIDAFLKQDMQRRFHPELGKLLS
ncbi:MAG: carbohydrate kinase family protein [Planctomycetota bacterium]|jgi:fructokinase